MPPRWEDIAETLRRRTRRLVSVRGGAWLALIVVGLLWTIGIVDWAVHLDAGWVRLLLAIAVITVIGVTLWKMLLRPLSVRLSDVDVARTIERRFPEWGDRLSSAAQFRSEQQSARLGSPDLQRSVVADADRQLGGIDVEQVLESKPTRRLAMIATAACFVGIAAALWQQTAAATVLQRLAMPFADIAWPRTTELQFLDSELQPLDDGLQRTAAGEPVALYLENRLGDLPEDVTLELRLPDGREEQRTLPTTMLRDVGGVSHEVGIASLTAHVGPVRFRAVGGDDHEMPWRTLEVVPPPVLSKVTITVTPPAYAVQEPMTLNGAGAIEALVGSVVQFAAEANKPLSSVLLRREGQPPQAMTATDDGRRFEAAFTVAASGRSWYWFDITDEHGLGQTNPPRYEIRGVLDRKPTVFIETPSTDLTVTADADVPLRIIARDDLGVRELRLVYSRPGEPAVRVPLGLSRELPVDETAETVWSLAALGLSAGDRITYYVEAIDAFDLPSSEEARSGNADLEKEIRRTDLEVRPTDGRPGQVGISAHQHLDVLSDDEKQQELAARQLGILDTLEALKARQSRALETTAGLRIQAELAQRLQADDLDLLKQTELEQQAIRGQLGDESSGAAAEVETLQQELDHNHIDDPQTADRLAELAEDLRILKEELLPGVEQSLARARKQSSSDPQQELRRAEQTQSSALTVLEEATGRLGSWRKQYEVTSQLDSLIADQTDVQEETEDVGRETLTKRPDGLTPQQRADLARLSDRQRRLASRLEELLKRGTTDEPSNDSAGNPTSSAGVDAMQEALGRLAVRGTLSQMHKAAESLKRNDIARTAAAQQQVLRDLRDFGEQLQAGAGDAAQTLLSRIEEQAEEVETLKKRQNQLVREAQQAMGPTADPDRDRRLERLIKEQEQLAEKAEELARQLRRQRSGQSAQSAARAARRMREAQRAIEQQQPEETAQSQQDALDDLSQLAGELAERRQEIEQELVRQQVEQLADDLQGLADRQESLIEQTLELDARQRERGSWSRSLRKELREVTAAQTALSDRLDELRAALGEYPVIELSLEQAAAPMREAVGLLEQNDVSKAVVGRQRTARLRLMAIIDVTRSANESQEQTASNSGPQQTPPGQQGQQGQQTPQLLGTQLRLLRHLQADVQQRTVALTERLKSGDPGDDDIAAQRESLARDQSRIAELTQTLLEQFTEMPGGTNPDKPEPEAQP